MTKTIDPNQYLSTFAREELLGDAQPTQDQARRINELIETWAERDPTGGDEHESRRLGEQVAAILDEAHPPLTLDELLELDWEVESVETDYHHFDTQPDPLSDPEAEEQGVFYISWLTGGVTLCCKDRPELLMTFGWSANGGQRTFADAYDFTVGVDDNEPGFELDAGPTKIVDEDGEPQDVAWEIGRELAGRIDWETEVRKHLPTMPEPETIDDIDEDTDMETIMETIELERDNGPDVRFQGEKIAHESSHHFEGPRNTRWTELTLYKTAGGKWVCHEVGRTCWQGEHDRKAVHVADTDAELIEAVGYGRLAKDLYDEAGIDHAAEID